MVATLIITISSMAMYIMFIEGQKLMMDQEHRRAVFELAKQRLTIYKVLSDENILSQNSDDDGEEAIHTIGGLTITANYEVNVTIDESAYYRVEVIYTWMEDNDVECHLTLVDNFPMGN